MADGQKNKSEIIRNYAIAVFFAIAALASIAVGLTFFKLFGLESFGASGTEPLWTSCEQNDEQAAIFINANQRLEEVKCTALDADFFEETEINLCSLERSDSDVCRFTLKGNTNQPMRFEVQYNGKTRRLACPQTFTGFGVD